MPRLSPTRWDVVEHLTTKEDMALYLEAALEEGDPKLIVAAVGDVARASGRPELAEAPDLAAALRAIQALGLHLRVSAER